MNQNDSKRRITNLFLPKKIKKFIQKIHINSESFAIVAVIFSMTTYL